MGVFLEVFGTVLGLLLIGAIGGALTLVVSKRKTKSGHARLDVYRAGKLISGLFVAPGESVTLRPKSGAPLTLRCIHSSWFELTVPEDLSVQVPDKNRVVEI